MPKKAKDTRKYIMKNTKSPGSANTTPKSQSVTSNLSELENIITQHFDNHFKAAEALATIRDNKLYDGDYKTFEEYCLKRWNYSRSYATRLADTHKVMLDLKEYHDKGVYPKNEAQARVFVGLDTDKRLKLAEAVMNDETEAPLTASLLTKIKAKLFPKKSTSKPNAAKAKTDGSTAATKEIVTKAYKSTKKLYQNLVKDGVEDGIADDLKALIECLEQILNPKANS